jgi:hypothetical protein
VWSFHFSIFQALNVTLEHQRNLAKAKLEARRRRRDDKQYEEDIATSLLMMAEQESSLVREKTMIQRSKQGESVSMIYECKTATSVRRLNKLFEINDCMKILSCIYTFV